MKYERPELIDRLASEFVLGTLRGAARRRFERLVPATPALQEAVAEWEERLMPIALALPPVTPPPAVWRRIVAQIPVLDRPHSPWWDRINVWRGLAITSVGALSFLFVVHEEAHDQMFPQTYVAVLNAPAGTPSMLVTAKQVGHTLTVKVLAPIDVGGGRMLALWAMPNSGRPMYLGAIEPAGVSMLHVGSETGRILRGVSSLAVTVEPDRGQPPQAPSGPEVYRGPLLEST